MSYKDLLLQIDDSRASDERIGAAIALSRHFDAHLSGLYVVPELVMPVVEGYLSAEFYADIHAREMERAEATMARFKAKVEAEGVGYDIRIDQATTGTIAERCALHSRYADLFISGQPDPEDVVPAGPAPEDLVLALATPLLVVPYIGTQAVIGERVMVAWNASREAARAVQGAMPLLKAAKSVDVVTFRPRGSSLGHGDMPGADIALHLARHGVKVDVQRLEGESIDVGNALLSHLSDRGTDLLVMGGYGHSRLREVVLGGATRTILRSMTVPVLMAH